jgi:alkyl sulfatase BDS1-like metallo-beta-lactamase superfamily hydrolase
MEALIQQQLPPAQALSEGKVKIEGNAVLLPTFFGLLDRFPGNFPVVDAAPWPA